MIRKRRQPRHSNVVRLDAEGLCKVLGDLEARIMRAVWDADEPLPARRVHELVLREHEVHLLTVVTVLNKLVDKQLLAREKRHDLYHYRARISEEEFRTAVARRFVEGMLPFGPAAMAASLVEVLAERDPERLEELARLVRRRLKERGER